MIRKYLTLGLVACALAPLFAQSQQDLSQQLDEMVRQGIADWQVPALAVAVVKDQEVLFMKTYGENELGKGEQANDQTMFMMGSTTKALTAMALAMLIDEGKLNWEDKVIDYLPEFRLKDPYVTRELTIRDLLTHRSGMGNTDFLWIGDASTEEILHKMRLIDPQYSFRGGYTYQNIMYVVAGEVVEKLSGMSWEGFIQTRIFDPLGMERSTPKGRNLAKMGNFVKPHYIMEDEVKLIPRTDIDAIAAAGDAWASIEDMTKWMNFLLDDAKVDGEYLVQPETFEELFQPQIIIPKSQFYATAALSNPTWTSYAMGWFQHDYKHYDLSYHTGSLAGLIAIIGLVRSEGFGVYVFGNVDHAELRHAIMYKAIDLYLDKDNSRNWHKEVFELFHPKDAPSESTRPSLNIVKLNKTKPSLKLSEYVGNFSHPYLGNIAVQMNNSSKAKLNMEYEQLQASLSHWHINTFQVEWSIPRLGNSMIDFLIDPAGKVNAVSFWGERFNKKP